MWRVVISWLDRRSRHGMLTDFPPCRHRWDHDIKEWVKMDAEEEKQRKLEATERKKKEMEERLRLEGVQDANAA